MTDNKDQSQVTNTFNQESQARPVEMSQLEKLKIQMECRNAVASRIGGRAARSARGFKL